MPCVSFLRCLVVDVCSGVEDDADDGLAADILVELHWLLRLGLGTEGWTRPVEMYYVGVWLGKRGRIEYQVASVEKRLP